jgi:hypothetical protein
MQPRPLEETMADMRGFVRRRIATGFYPPEDIETDAAEVYAEEHDRAVLKSLAARLTREAFADHLAAQKSWPAVTDCDLLDRALGELERAGVVCRQNFSCCMT